MVMRAHPGLLTSLLLAVALVLTGCSDDDGPARGKDPVTASNLADVELDDDLGCGYGFAATDSAERVLLVIRPKHDATDAVRRTVTLPDPDWSAEVRTGTNLAANWCNDVITDPEAEVEETWEVVGGTLTFAGDLPTTDRVDIGSPEEVRAELTGLVVEGPDGERVELGDLSLRNKLWGVFAG